MTSCEFYIYNKIIFIHHNLYILPTNVSKRSDIPNNKSNVWKKSEIR